jgi:hypothetical protein
LVNIFPGHSPDSIQTRVTANHYLACTFHWGAGSFFMIRGIFDAMIWPAAPGKLHKCALSSLSKQTTVDLESEMRFRVTAAEALLMKSRGYPSHFERPLKKFGLFYLEDIPEVPQMKLMGHLGFLPQFG